MLKSFFQQRFFVSLVLIFCFTTLILSFHSVRKIPAKSTHFVLQAQAFLQGHLDIPPSGLNDLAFFHDSYYVPFGPLPSVLLIPFVFLTSSVPQQILGIFALVITFTALYKLCKQLGMKTNNALWMAIFFIFGTIYVSLVVINASAYLVQVITILFVILALLEYFGKKRFFIIGTYIGLGILTRDIIIFSTIFFVLEILWSKEITRKLRSCTLLFLPILVSITILFTFNYARFGNLIDNGYDHNISHGYDLSYARSKGFFSLTHIPGNIYLLFFKGPDAIKENPASYVLQFPYMKIDQWGLSIFITSPLFLYLLFVNVKKPFVLSALITVGVMIIPMLTYYAYGAWQYGYRHAADFYPFLFIILISIFQETLPTRAKILICFGILFNFYFMLSLWNIYPL